jgi:hypothetical protein
MGFAKEIKDDLLRLAERDGAVIEQGSDGSRKVTPVTPPEQVIVPTPVRPAQTSWSD